MSDVSFYLPIAKIDREQRMVFGYASTPTRDLDGEVIELEAIKDALPGYMEWRNIREMHQPSAVGVAKEANVDDKGLYIGAKIVDDDAWKKVTEEVYKGFSIGGNVTDRKGSTITGLDLIEISLVDRPANPDCRIDVIKAAGAAKDNVMADLSAGTPQDAGEVGWLRRMVEKLAGSGTAEKADKKPYGDVEYADPGYQKDKKKRYPIDTEEHIRAAWNYIHQKRNADKYTAQQLAAIKRRIIAAWKKKIDEKGPPERGKAAETGDLAKGMGAAQMLAYVADQLEYTADCLRYEAAEEGGDPADCVLADDLCAIRCDVLDVIAAKAQHETREQEPKSENNEQLGNDLSGETKMGGADLTKGAADGRQDEELRKAVAAVREAIKGFEKLAGTIEPAAPPEPKAAETDLAKAPAVETVTKREAELMVEAALLKGKVEAMEKQPQSPKARLFAVPRGSLPVSEAEEPSAMEKLFKGVNIEATDPGERQNAAARMIGNMIANPATFARPVIGDPTFKGGAAR